MPTDPHAEFDEADSFRANLYVRVGAVTIAAGHAEYAMRRLLSLLAAGTPNMDRDLPVHWDELERKLRAEAKADPGDERRRRLAELLEWADRKNIRERRNNVIHGAWSTDHRYTPRVARFQRRQAPLDMFFSFEALDSVADRLREFTRGLNDLVDHEE